ncbi:MAG: lipoprotein [Vitreoscilla sp.]|nr:lipoprotein [Polaromonas sp.]
MFYLHRIIAVTVFASALSGCGQKGPLFLTPQSVPYSLFPGSAAVPPPPLPVPPASPASAAK